MNYGVCVMSSDGLEGCRYRGCKVIDWCILLTNMNFIIWSSSTFCYVSIRSAGIKLC
jgi:hypothetical protein